MNSEQSITLTVQQILDLVEFTGVGVLSLVDVSTDELENEITIAACPVQGIKNEGEPDDPETYSHYDLIAYCADYPEEGCVGLGPELAEPIARALEQPASAAGVEGWRPIESAPRDGTPILLGYIGSHSEEGRWMGDPERNHWRETGWFATDDDVLCEHPSHPDAWMPLPAAPQPATKESR